MSCAGNCEGACGGGSYRSPITHWRQTGQGVEGAPIPGQPGRAPGAAAGGRGVPWWMWILLGLLALQLLKKGPF